MAKDNEVPEPATVPRRSVFNSALQYYKTVLFGIGLGQILLAITYGGATAHLPNGAFFWWGGIILTCGISGIGCGRSFAMRCLVTFHAISSLIGSVMSFALLILQAVRLATDQRMTHFMLFLGNEAYAITLEVFPAILSMVLCITSVVFCHKTMAVANTRGWSSGCFQITVLEDPFGRETGELQCDVRD